MKIQVGDTAQYKIKRTGSRKDEGILVDVMIVGRDPKKVGIRKNSFLVKIIKESESPFWVSGDSLK